MLNAKRKHFKWELDVILLGDLILITLLVRISNLKLRWALDKYKCNISQYSLKAEIIQSFKNPSEMNHGSRSKQQINIKAELNSMEREVRHLLSVKKYTWIDMESCSMY